MIRSTDSESSKRNGEHERIHTIKEISLYLPSTFFCCLMVPSDKDILEAYFRDENIGLKALFDTYYTPLCLFAERMTGDLQTAEDIVQDVFIKCWKEKAFYSIRSSARAYLYNAVRNTTYNYLKKQGSISFIHIEEVDISTDGCFPGEASDKETTEQLRSAINQLPKKCREVFVLVIMEELSYKAAAKRLDISVNTVKTQLSRAFSKIRKRLFPKSTSL